jgi:hydrogenase/urease accessory protein HupE
MTIGLANPANLVAMIGLGLLLVAFRRVPSMVVAAAAALIGLILGYRSGVDMAQAGVGVQFMPGVA